MWLPPGGHIERGELPDDAAVRELLEETGLEVKLAGKRREDVADPVQLHRPASAVGEHWVRAPAHRPDLLRPSDWLHGGRRRVFCREGRLVRPREDWEGMPVNAEVRGWCERALAFLSGV